MSSWGDKKSLVTDVRQSNNEDYDEATVTSICLSARMIKTWLHKIVTSSILQWPRLEKPKLEVWKSIQWRRARYESKQIGENYPYDIASIGLAFFKCMESGIKIFYNIGDDQNEVFFLVFADCLNDIIKANDRSGRAGGWG